MSEEQPNKTSEKNKRWNLQMIIIVAIIAGLTIAFVWGATIEPCCSVSVEDDLGDLLQNSSQGNVSSKDTASVDKVEIYHFHGDRQCYSCVRLGELAEKTVNTYFKEELDSGKIVFGHINYDSPENKELADKYGVAASSLWIGVYIDDEFKKEENVNVWYKINNEEAYLSYLKELLEKRLEGDFS